MQKIKVRKAVSKDIEGIMKLLNKGSRQGLLLKRNRKEVEGLVNEGNFFIAEFNGRIIGTIALDVYSKRLAELRSIIVEKNSREKGIGKKLVKKAFERAKSLGVKELMTVVFKKRKKWFEKQGFNEEIKQFKTALFKKLR